MKKVLMFIMAVIVLTTTVFTGCSKSGDTKATETSNSQVASTSANTEKATEQPNTKGWQLSNTGTLGTLPIADPAGSKTLKITASENWDTSKSLSQPLPVWQEIEKKTGVKIDFEVLANAQYVDTMMVRLAAGSNLPDIFVAPIKTGFTDYVKITKNKLVIPLNDLIEEYAPNTKKFFEDNPNLKNIMKAPDGQIYGLSAVISGVLTAQPRVWAIRKDWLDKLGLKEPETIEDWYNVLKAFKEKDPNGNGKNDEIPLAVEMEKNDVLTLGNAWGLHLGTYGYGYFPDTNGKVQCEYIDPKAKEVYAFANKLYKDGLLDPDFITATGYQALNEKIQKNLVGVTMHFVSNYASWENALKSTGVSDAKYAAIAPPVLNSGEKSFYMTGNETSGFVCISKDCKDTETAMKWFDYVYASEEGNRYQTWGIEGLSYVLKDGKPTYTDFVLKNPDGKSAFLALCSIGSFTTAMPTIRNSSGPLGGQAEALNINNPELRALADKVKTYLVPGARAQIILPTAEEADLLIDLDKKGLETYKNEMIAKFIVGSESLNKFDEFVAKMKSLGAEQKAEVQQDQLDRISK
jgi:ABC-type sugar transport system, periplasmic component